MYVPGLAEYVSAWIGPTEPRRRVKGVEGKWESIIDFTKRRRMIGKKERDSPQLSFQNILLVEWKLQ